MRRTRWIHESEWPMLKRLLYFVVLAGLFGTTWAVLFAGMVIG